jgi:single-stranded-DNA-specific exonuclease
LMKLAPFGAGNPEPLLSAEVAGVEPRILVSKTGDADHLKFQLGSTDSIGFGMAEKGGLLRSRAQVAFTLAVDTWNGRVRAQAKVRAIDDAPRH